MGNMGQQHLGNATSVASLLHQLRDMWKSPRGTVLRIEALALLAIFLSFFLAIFGSCRRWSNNFLIQKGFMAANALFLSLGTYSIGLMQSSPVKSEMYPIWAVSLLALLCCVDSAAASGLDNRNQLWKMLYQLCLYFGYVLLMSITTISSDIGNIAICVLSAVTFIKGFHRSMALVLPSSMRNMIREIPGGRITKCSFGDPNEERELIVDDKLDVMTEYDRDDRDVNMGDITSMRCEGNNKMLESKLNSCKDVCLSFSLSHLLHRRFLGLSSVKPIKASLAEPLVKNCKRALKVVEIELAFLHDILYTSNTFLHYYEAKSASIWTFASVIGICFVGAVAVIPGSRKNRRASPDTIFVDTTIVDFVITGVVLVSLALLQVLQLLSCWTSNWARVAFACDYARKDKWNRIRRMFHIEKEVVLSWGMRLRASLLKINWYDKYYMWQNQLGQHAVIDESFWTRVHGCLSRQCHQLFCCGFLGKFCGWICSYSPLQEARCISRICCYLVNILVQRCFGLLGLQYISRELKEMLQGSCTGSTVDLHPDVKASIGDFVDNEIMSNEISGWASSKVENGQSGFPDFSFRFTVDDKAANAAELNDMIYVSCILIWHVATCYCELAQQCDHNNGSGHPVTMEKDHRRVATDLSKYCAYLVASAPRLLLGRSETIKFVYGQVREEATRVGKGLFSSAAAGDKLLQAMDTKCAEDHISVHVYRGVDIYGLGVKLGKGLQSMDAAERWKLLADFWVKALVYAAPSDKVEEHMQHLSQGGELITHLWAMLYHAGIQRWQLNPPAPNDINMGWDYIFRVCSWKDLKPSHKGPVQKIQKNLGKMKKKFRLFRWGKRQPTGQDHPSEMRSDACRGARLDGASTSWPPPSS